MSPITVQGQPAICLNEVRSAHCLPFAEHWLQGRQRTPTTTDPEQGDRTC